MTLDVIIAYGFSVLFMGYEDSGVIRLSPWGLLLAFGLSRVRHGGAGVPIG